jgi:hypothetical protein
MMYVTEKGGRRGREQAGGKPLVKRGSLCNAELFCNPELEK